MIQADHVTYMISYTEILRNLFATIFSGSLITSTDWHISGRFSCRAWDDQSGIRGKSEARVTRPREDQKSWDTQTSQTAVLGARLAPWLA